MTAIASPARGMVLRFDVPPDAVARTPPEDRGLQRDEVRLLVAAATNCAAERIVHTRFRRLADHLDPGDLVVVNTSATVAAAVDGRRHSGMPVTVHFSGPARHGGWIVELRDGKLGRVRDAASGERIAAVGGVRVTLQRAWPDPRATPGSRLWLASVDVEVDVEQYLAREGRPITYAHLTGRRPLADYQTIFAREPGSAEMPSAGRPFSRRVVADLRRRGVGLAAITLHTGVSSLEADELPLPERFAVSQAAADAVNATRASGGRVVAVGTTVARALETVGDTAGNVAAGNGVTSLVLGPDRPARVVNGLITGWHEPQASHLLLLQAVAGDRLVEQAYRAAVSDPQRYLWHEFGDSCLLLPGAGALLPC